MASKTAHFDAPFGLNFEVSCGSLTLAAPCCEGMSHCLFYTRDRLSIILFVVHVNAMLLVISLSKDSERDFADTTTS